MMKKNLKKEAGVSLISLGIAIMIILVITNMVLYNVKDNLGIHKLESMQADIENLSDKVSSYYSQYGSIPAKTEYTNTVKLESAGIISSAVDTGKFYVIDLQSLENLTLTYGQDYEKIQTGNVTTQEEINQLEDLYIINETSHNVFYVRGITIDGETFYTNYTKDEVDTVPVDLRYVDNVKIPEGYTYVSGNKDTVITIKNNADESDIYTWIPVEDTITTLPDGVTVDNEADFLESVNKYKGYYKSQSDNSKVVYIPLEEEWSPTYDKTANYTDQNQDTALVPEGFQISKVPGENVISTGLVARNAETDDRYVWVPVPKTVFTNVETSTDYEAIQKDLKAYTADYSLEGYSDTWYDGCGLTQPEYENLYNEMLTSVYQNNGFWVSQYEIGTDTFRTSTTTDSALGVAKSQVDLYPYGYVTVAQAQTLSSNMSSGDRNSSLLFGIQWDLVCKYFEETGVLTKDQILKDTSEYANVMGSTLILNRGKYVLIAGNGELPTQAWEEVNENVFQKNSGALLLYTAGATEMTKINNIYDMVGNMFELTLEQKENSYITLSGSAFNESKNHCYLSYRYDKANIPYSFAYYHVSFRTTIF